MAMTSSRAAARARPTVVDPSERTIRAVYIPADLTQPIREIDVAQKAGDAIGCFTTYCKEHFAKSSMCASQLKTFKIQMEAQAKGKEVPDDLLKAMALMTTCDIVTLQPNNVKTDFISVNMYVDDKGVAKQLPVNKRATLIGRECGCQLAIMGDAFIGRQYDDDEGFHRYDFTLQDLDPKDPMGWMQKARSLNQVGKRKGKQAHSVKFEAMQRRMAALQLQLDKQLDMAQGYKAAGNTAFQHGEYARAIAEYSEGLKALGLPNDPEGDDGERELTRNDATEKLAHLIFSNRSACFMKLKQFKHALSDANACTRLQPKWAKGWGRRADALAGIGRIAEAITALENALKLSPKSKDLIARKVALTKQLE